MYTLNYRQYAATPNKPILAFIWTHFGDGIFMQINFVDQDWWTHTVSGMRTSGTPDSTIYVFDSVEEKNFHEKIMKKELADWRERLTKEHNQAKGGI